MNSTKLVTNTADTVALDDPAVEAIRGRIARWQELFSPDTEQYSLSGYEELFAQGPGDLLVYDNFAERETRWYGFDVYRATWEQQINSNFPTFVMFRVDIDEIQVHGDIAWSAFTWFGTVVDHGEEQVVSQHATHVWRLIDGLWRIRHEHLTSGVKEAGQPAFRNPREKADSRAFVHERAARAA